MGEMRPYPLDPLYGVTEDGRIFRLDRPRSGRICPYELVPNKGRRGYLTVAIGKRTTPIHILVARTFIPNPAGLPEVAHGNGNRHDNRVDNLRWATRKSNNDDRFEHGTVLHSDAHPTRKLSVDEVKKIRESYAAGGIYQRELGAMYGVTRECIGRITRRDNWQRVK